MSGDRDDETTRLALDRPLNGTPPAGVRRNRPCFVVIAGANVGALYRASHGAILGRAGDATVRIDSEEVSRRHARLVAIDDAFVLEDMGSRNGTFVNGVAVKGPTPLQDGDKIEVAGTILRFALFDELDEAYQERMYESSLRDGLTRAFNRKYFDERLDGEVAYAMRHDTPLSLLLFDIDYFKAVNDTWGHVVGDAILVQLVQHVLRVIRAEDVLARYGGEEFAILSRGIWLRDAGMFAERLRTAVERHPFMHGDQRVPVTVSVGVAALPAPDIAQPSQLVARADGALYRAKNSGRNQTVVSE